MAASRGQVLYYIDNSSYDNSRLYDYIMKDSTESGLCECKKQL